MDISAENKSNTFQLAFSSTDMDEEFNTNEYSFENSDFDDNQALLLTVYKVGGDTYDEHFPSAVSIYKTSQDVNNNTISGTFTAVLDKAGSMQDEVETPEQINITEGKFTKLKYTEYHY
ncbi:hypothetical protein [Flavobacterium sp. H122]|uniref:hypothetical protein n=1 Tax=Flavobacterium sp. H122 TaxID=2529860 RepID=UPI0010AB2DF6|nr:hypothetical protein [Flavobacterium sp. H122]